MASLSLLNFDVMRARALLIGYLIFVVYGSLVPLDFKAVPIAVAWRQFQAMPYLSLGVESRADWVANGVLYLPLGTLLALALSNRDGRLLPVVGTLGIVTNAAIAVSVEFVQLYFPPRTVSVNDVMAECIGGTLGLVLVPMFRGPINRVRDGWFTGGARFASRALEVYAAGYVALSFFPYDLLLSRSEIADKAVSNMWGWLFAHDERGVFLIIVQLLVELGLVVPLGVLFGQLAAPRLASLPIAAVLGVLLGLFIELGQFFVASGVSQGASLASRGLGLVLGVVLARHLARGGIEGLRQLARRSAWIVVPAYVLLLLAVNGWFHRPWHGMSGAAAAWADLRLMPFYYHYFTTEAAALYSLGSVALMYLPIALIGWVFRFPVASTLGVIVGAAAVIETSKLFLTDLHPDPTNLLIAPAAAWLALATASLAERPVAQPDTLASAAPPHDTGRPLAWIGLLAVLLIVALCTWQFPAFRVLLGALLAGSVVAVWVTPMAALAIIPAALPMLDFAPWTGRFYWDEFDLLLAACLAVTWYRLPEPADDRLASRWPNRVFGLVAASLAISSVVAMLPWRGLGVDDFYRYDSPFNPLRIAKGAVWAWMFVAVYGKLSANGDRRDRWLGSGMLVGLAWTIAFVAWERGAQSGLFDFASDFRVSGPFSPMHKGGAYLECYLVIAAAFALRLALVGVQAWARLLGAVLTLGAVYAVMVTYSRNGYAALLVTLLLVWFAHRRRLAGRGTAAWSRAAVIVGVVAVVAAVLTGSFARERLAESGRDLGIRWSHWTDALSIRDDAWLAQLFGEGLGRYPERHFWRSHEQVHAAAYRLLREGNNGFLRLGPGATLYLDQIIEAPVTHSMTLSADARASAAGTALAVSVCRKWLLTSQGCVHAGLPVRQSQGWQHVETSIDLSPLLASQRGLVPLPLTLSVSTPQGPGTLDVDNLQLQTVAGANAVTNGSFESGMDRWFFTTDVDPPWHIHSLPLTVLFELGWFGAIAWTVWLGLAVVTGWLRLREGNPASSVAWPALIGMLVCGSVNSLIDAPRFVWLLVVLSWLAMGADLSAVKRSAGTSPSTL